MYENIASNKRKTGFLIIGFLIFICAIGYAVGLYLDYRYGANGGYSIVLMIFALIIAVAVSFWSYYGSDKLVLKLTRARQLQRDQNPKVYYMVEGLSIAAGLPMPKVYIIEDNGMNAFATGRNPSNGIIVLTSGLIDNLSDSELKGVIAHELSHIKNYDILLGTIIVALVGMIAIISNIILRGFIFGGGRRKSARSSGGGILSIIFLILGLILIIISPIIATIIKLAISRSREYLADSNSALITRYPAGLANALRKISARGKIKAANNAMAHLFIANPFGIKQKNFLSNLFNTHPPAEERIRRLENMALGVGVK